MAAVSLRDYQLDIISRICGALQEHRSVMVQMPTGTGKTHVLADVVNKARIIRADKYCKTNGTVWIIAHRHELVTQIEETLCRHKIRTNEDDRSIRVMSIQWLTRHWDDADGTPGLVIIDEAHHAQAKTYRALWEKLPEAMFLGLTATPCRMNRSGFTDLFDTLICSWSIATFIEKGRLSAFDYISIRANSAEQRLIDSLKKRGADGDYQIKEMNERLNKRPSIERLYHSVDKFAHDKKGIVYAISIDHARSIAEYYTEKGITAVAIDSRTPASERKQIVADFKTGKIRILVNVDIFSEGFDCPDVEFVQMARPTLSLSKYLQQAGRGLRKTDGKETCILIDNVGLYRVFGLPTSEWNWEAIFRGETAGKGVQSGKSRSENMVARMPMETMPSDREMEMIMSHRSLLSVIAKQREALSADTGKSPELKTWQDKDTGLYGLCRDNKRMTQAVFTTVFDTGYDMAAVKFKDNTCGLVTYTGETILGNKQYGNMQFSGNHFLIVKMPNGKFHYIDLRNMHIYNERPEVKRYGRIELLKTGNKYHSRTKHIYTNDQNLNNNAIDTHNFYVSIFDYKAPAQYGIYKSWAEGYKSGYACLLADDYDSFYWIVRRLTDGSIIIADDSGKLYHAADGKAKKHIGSISEHIH